MKKHVHKMEMQVTGIGDIKVAQKGRVQVPVNAYSVEAVNQQ